MYSVACFKIWARDVYKNINLNVHTYRVVQKNGATLSHCKYSENYMTELHGNWWISAIFMGSRNFRIFAMRWWPRFFLRHPVHKYIVSSTAHVTTATTCHFTALFQVHLGEPVLSQRRDLLEQPLNFYEPAVLPANQPVMSKHYTKTQWFGRHTVMISSLYV